MEIGGYDVLIKTEEPIGWCFVCVVRIFNLLHPCNLIEFNEIESDDSDVETRMDFFFYVDKEGYDKAISGDDYSGMFNVILEKGLVTVVVEDKNDINTIKLIDAIKEKIATKE